MNFMVSFIETLATDMPEHLMSISSGLVADANVKNDLRQARVDGYLVTTEFLTALFMQKTTSFHEPIKQAKHKYFPMPREQRLDRTVSLKVIASCSLGCSSAAEVEM